MDLTVVSTRFCFLTDKLSSVFSAYFLKYLSAYYRRAKSITRNTYFVVVVCTLYYMCIVLYVWVSKMLNTFRQWTVGELQLIYRLFAYVIYTLSTVSNSILISFYFLLMFFFFTLGTYTHRCTLWFTLQYSRALSSQ